jgi:hypothetical protein
MLGFNKKKPKVLISSVPKAGTHLLSRCLELLGFEDLQIAVNENGYADHRERGDLHTWQVLAGREDILNPRKLKKPCAESLPLIGEGQFAIGHLHRSPLVAGLIRDLGLRHLFIYRDPRDVAVSWYRYCTYSPEKNAPMLYYYVYNALGSDSERLLMSITGVKAGNFLPDLHQRHFKNRVEWIRHPGTLAVRFEDLVGSSGGGSREIQLETIRKVAEWVGLPGGQEERVAESLFGGSKTFTRGKAAAWVPEFQPEHKAAFREVTGSLLADLGYEEGDGW